MDTKAMIKKTVITRGDAWSKAYRVTVKLELEDLGQGAYFAATVDIDRKARNNHWYEFGGGADHERIRKHFPRFAKYLKWHCWHLDRGAWHYIENALHHAGKSSYPDKANVEYFKSTIAAGAIPGENVDFTLDELLACDADDIRQTLEERRPAVLKVFHDDMRELFGAEVVDRLLA